MPAIRFLIIGCSHTPENRAFLSDYFDNILNDNSNIVKTEQLSYVANDLPSKPTITYTATTRESLLMGPDGGALYSQLGMETDCLQ